MHSLYCDFHNSAESHLQAPSAKQRFGCHQSNFQTKLGRSTPPLESELEFLLTLQLEYYYDLCF